MKLAELNIGEKGIVLGFVDEEAPVRFHEMGLLPGTVLMLEHKAPFNGPLCISITPFGSRLALRKTEADCVVIERTEDGV